MAVHHIDMDPVGTGGVDRADFLAKTREIGGQYRRRDADRLHAPVLSMVRFDRKRTFARAGRYATRIIRATKKPSSPPASPSIVGKVRTQPRGCAATPSGSSSGSAGSSAKRLELRLALLGLERAGGIDQQALGPHPGGGARQQLRLDRRHFGEQPRTDAVEHVGMAAEDPGGAARRIDQHRVERLRRRPLERIGGDDLRLEPRALQIFG